MSRKGFVAVISVTGVVLAVLVLGLREIQRFHSAQGAAESSGSTGDVPTIRFVNNPEPVPSFTVETLDGRTISTASLSDKVVLVNFWATWCPPCIAEIPDLIELQNQYEGQLQIIGLSVEEGSADEVKRFVQEKKINYPVAIASGELLRNFGGVFGLPTTFLLDTDGGVVQKHIGPINPQFTDLEIRALLGLPVNAKIEVFEDTGEVLLSNANKADEVPGVDLSRLDPTQMKTALRQLNEQTCTCGCGLTLAQCRINDSSCPVSPGLANQVVERILAGS